MVGTLLPNVTSIMVVKLNRQGDTHTHTHTHARTETEREIDRDREEFSLFEMVSEI